MYEQLSFLPEISTKESKKENRKVYASPCGGCQCNSCVNNVNCLHVKPNEVETSCFNCDDCYYYGHNRDKKHNKKYECSNFKISNHEVMKNRSFLFSYNEI